MGSIRKRGTNSAGSVVMRVGEMASNEKRGDLDWVKGQDCLYKSGEAL